MVELGDKLSGRYLLTELIGQGGMANVFLADDLILEREVAVKVLRYDFQENKEAIKRFQREAMSASQLLHHNIVELYDVDEEDKQQYIVMEYVKGQDLKELIRQEAPLSLELVVKIMSQILSAIEIAHKHNIIHRDIKPQNILITEGNEVRITDFGIAIALSDTSITQTNTLLGSVHYLSPEQARGGNATTKSDIYALGVVLFELITGNVPFDGESAVSVALKHFQEDFPRIKDQIDYVPQSLENVVLKATAKNPNDRYETVGEMLEDLQTALNPQRLNEPLFIPPSTQTTKEPVQAIEPITPKVSSAKLSAPEPLNEELYPDIEEVVPVDPPRKHNRWLRILFGLLLIIGSAIGIWYFIQHNVTNVSVPSFADVTIDEVEALLEENKLTLGEVTHDWDETLLPGFVISSNPESGTKVPRQSAVDLVVSNGKEQVEIGNYVGETYESIRSKLRELGFIVERRDMASSPSQDGLILDQSLDAGQRVVPSETSIVFYVGNAQEDAVMPDFYNDSEDMVHRFAEGYNLTVDVEYAYNDYVTEGLVISQEPDSGTPLNPGDTLSVVVSQGPREEIVETATVNVPIEYVPKYSDNDVEQLHPLPNKIQVFIGDSRNNINQVADEFEITDSQTIQILLYILDTGVGQYRIMRDDEIVAESAEVYPDVAE